MQRDIVVLGYISDEGAFMGFRTVVIKSPSKIESKLDYLLIKGEEERWIHMSEIDTLIVESTACTITAHALSQLATNNANVIFCDEKHQPHSFLYSFYGHHLTSGMIKRQIDWSKTRKNIAWREIVRQKIAWQANVLRYHKLQEQSKLLGSYESKVEIGDSTNREGHAAKVYFNALFGMGFGRREDNAINTALNYGYAIVLSATSREIVAAGYCTQIGIHHINEHNQYNLASDIMEVFRPLVDAYIFGLVDLDDYKQKTTRVLSAKVKLQGKEHYLDSAIRQFVRSVMNFMDKSGDILKIEEYIVSKDIVIGN